MYVTDRLSFKIGSIKTQSCTKRNVSWRKLLSICSKLVSDKTGPRVTRAPLRLTRWFASTSHCLKHKGGTVTWWGKLDTRSKPRRWLTGYIRFVHIDEDWWDQWVSCLQWIRIKSWVWRRFLLPYALCTLPQLLSMRHRLVVWRTAMLRYFDKIRTM